MDIKNITFGSLDECLKSGISDAIVSKIGALFDLATTPAPGRHLVG